MGTLLAPSGHWVSCDWQCHRNRPNGGSPEPGTDYATPYGTDLAMAEDGTVSVVDHSNQGGEGRRVSIDLDNGQRVSYIHLAHIYTRVGARVRRGQRGICLSGASGYGKDWYYGPHVHVSLWARPGMAYRNTIDFERYVGEPAGLPDPEPFPPPALPEPPEEEDDMQLFVTLARTDTVNGASTGDWTLGHVDFGQDLDQFHYPYEDADAIRRTVLVTPEGVVNEYKGFLSTSIRSLGIAWGRAYGKGQDGQNARVPRDQYIEMQEALSLSAASAHGTIIIPAPPGA